MNVFITGEKGFIAKNLSIRSKEYVDVNVVTGCDKITRDKLTYRVLHTGEPCVFANEIRRWKDFFSEQKIDVVIHNAATVGTDVVALDPNHSTLTNIAGTYNICRAAKELGIAVCYIGTTVIYDTPIYQETQIFENSNRKPNTLYGCHKLCAEDIVKSQTDKWMIVRPLFAYGGEGDMNSLIAKTIYTELTGSEDLHMFLDPTKIKDYMHVNDFCDAVWECVTTQHCWNEDFNVAAETPYMTGEVVNIISKIMDKDVSGLIRWLPKTDYLGNHMLSSEKIRGATIWKPKISLRQGIAMSYASILNTMGKTGYNPLKYLQEAKSKEIDLTKFY